MIWKVGLSIPEEKTTKTQTNTHTYTTHKTPFNVALQKKDKEREECLILCSTLFLDAVVQLLDVTSGSNILTHSIQLYLSCGEHCQPIMKVSMQQQEVCVHMERSWLKRSHSDKNRGNIWRIKPKKQPST